MANTPASRKAKGRALQQTVQKKILESYSDLTPDDVRSAPMGVNGADIQLSSKGKERFPYSVEAKNTEKLNIYKAWDQASQNTEKDTKPILVVKKNHKKPLVVMDMEDFFNLIKYDR